MVPVFALQVQIMTKRFAMLLLVAVFVAMFALPSEGTYILIASCGWGLFFNFYATFHCGNI